MGQTGVAVQVKCVGQGRRVFIGVFTGLARCGVRICSVAGVYSLARTGAVGKACVSKRGGWVLAGVIEVGYA